MTVYFKNDFMTTLGDFTLQDASPLHRGSSEYRFTMGNLYIKPDFEKALALITIMISDQEMIQKYPLSENAQLIVQSKAIL